MIRRAFDIECTVQPGGHLPGPVARAFYSYLATREGKTIRLRVGRPQRSNAANAYLWGVVYKTIRAALAEAGQAVSAEDLHDHFKQKYLDPLPVPLFDGTHYRRPSSRRLDKEAFYDFVESIRTDEQVTSYGIVIDDPDPTYRSYTLHDLTF